MKLHLPFFLSLSLAALSADASAESVTVTTWDQFVTAVDSGATNIIFSGDMVLPSDANQDMMVNNVTLTGSEGNTITIPKGIVDGTTLSSALWNFSEAGGRMDGLNFTGQMENRKSLISVKEGSAVVISNCRFENFTAGSKSPQLLDSSQCLINYEGHAEGDKFEIRGSTFANNKNVNVNILMPFADRDSFAVIENCTFSGNSSLTGSDGGHSASVLVALGVKITGCSFDGNYIGFASEGTQGFEGEFHGGAVRASKTDITDSSFRNNFVMSGQRLKDDKTGSTGSKGGAIYAASLDGEGSDLNLRADKEDVIFSGNKMEVTHVENGKALDGIANAIWVDSIGFVNDITLRASAAEGKSIKFLDPIVMDTYFKMVSSTFSQQNIFLNEKRGDTGTIVFSGELYKDQADINRMSRIQQYVGITQNDGKVQITQKAIVGASMASADEATAKVGALNYFQNKGNLEISHGGHLMAGSFHLSGDGAENSGFNLCSLSVGNGATLTTGWAFMDKGVTFDLQLFTNLTSGLKVNIVNDAPNMLQPGVPIYNLADARIILGGTLGVANTLNYNENRWENDMEFLLFDFSGRTADQALTGDFTGIEIAGTGSSSVGGRGEWSLKWNDETAKDKLYAVWTATGGNVPEPSSAMLAMLGFSMLLTRRGKK